MSHHEKVSYFGFIHVLSSISNSDQSPSLAGTVLTKAPTVLSIIKNLEEIRPFYFILFYFTHLVSLTIMSHLDQVLLLFLLLLVAEYFILIIH